jgi:ABC-type transporter MlaC component
MKFLLIALTAMYAQAAAEPKAVVQEIFQKASAPEVAAEAAKQAEVNALVDFDALARAALGKQKPSAQDFAWFRDTLKEIIGRTVYPKAPEFLQGVKITYNSDETKGAKATVKSTVQNKADLTDVDYQLADEGAKGWKVVDVSISGQSWVESIRDEVGKVIKKSGWKGLKGKMNKRLGELKSGKS